MRRILLFSLVSLACLHISSKVMTRVGCKADWRKSWISGWEQSDKKWYASLEEDTDWTTSPLHTELSLVWAQIWRPGQTCRCPVVFDVRSGPERSLTFQGTSEVAKPNFNESHPTLLHPSADDSQIFDQHLNGMSQNGKCLVNVPSDSWYVVLPGAVESVKGS